MWFRHPAWIVVAWLLVIVNVVGVWLAAAEQESWHALIHAVLGVLCTMWAQWLARRRRAAAL